jgi:hypothetical protein
MKISQVQPTFKSKNKKVEISKTWGLIFKKIVQIRFCCKNAILSGKAAPHIPFINLP